MLYPFRGKFRSAMKTEETPACADSFEAPCSAKLGFRYYSEEERGCRQAQGEARGKGASLLVNPSLFA